VTFLEISDNNIQNFDNERANNLIFIDSNLDNYQTLIGTTSNSNVVVLDSQQNGIEQITEVLAKYSNLNSIQILSHGDLGLLQLGNANLSAFNLDSYQNDLAAWEKALSPNGDLLFYGCNVGATDEGFDFVERIAKVTGADVAASSDLTGNALLGGDWDLEVTTGEIEALSLNLTEYEDVFLNFNLTYGANTTSAQKQAFELAAKMWSDVISDNVTVNIHVNMSKNSDLPANTLGGAIPFFLQGTSYSNFRNALINDKTTGDDTKATASLETGTTWKTQIGSHNGGTSVESLSTVAMSRANAKALGLISSNDSTLDGLIVLNDLASTNASWQYNYSSSYLDLFGSFDFTSVAMHEIGHILGFCSAVDGTTAGNVEDYTLLGQAATSLDLFRYIAPNVRDMRMGYTDFSLNKGVINLEQMSGGTITGASFQGDGYQASHWNNNRNAGLMDPVAEKSVRSSIGNLDLQALDAIGWNRVASTKSVSTLTTEANGIASTKSNVNRNSEINTLLANWKWARRSGSGTLTQQGNLVQFLNQEGFFNIGSFNEKFALSSLTPTEVTRESYNYLDNIRDLSSDRESLVKTEELVPQPIAIISVRDNSTQEDTAEATITKLTEWLSRDELFQFSKFSRDLIEFKS
jgi:hypothetical protein